MNYYVEITLIDGEKSLYELWSMLYGQVHFVLASMYNKNIKTIGVSFPNYHFMQKGDKTFASLGDKLRIFAESQELLGVVVADLQNRLNEYVKNWDDFLHLKSVQAVPQNHRHAIFKRHRPKDLQKVAQRFARFKSIDFDTALVHCQNHKAKPQNYPFIELVSETSKKENKDPNFRLYIAKQSVESPISGEFGAYGLGGGSVPDF